MKAKLQALRRKIRTLGRVPQTLIAASIGLWGAAMLALPVFWALTHVSHPEGGAPGDGVTASLHGDIGHADAAGSHGGVPHSDGSHADQADHDGEPLPEITGTKHGESGGHGAGHGPSAHAAETAPVWSQAEAVLAKTDPAALKKIIALLLESGEPEKALPFMRKACEALPRDAAFQAEAAQYFLDLGLYPEAYDAQAAARAAGAHLPVLLAVEFTSLFHRGYLDSALALGQQAVLAHPDHADLWTALGILETEMGPDYRGMNALQRALEIDPTHPSALYQTGRRHQLSGNFADAERLYADLVRRVPEHAKAWAQLGIARYYLGQDRSAGESMVRALKLNPRDYNTWYNLGEYYVRRVEGETRVDDARLLSAKALKCFLNAVELKAEHPEAHYRIGLMMQGNGQYKEAIRHYRITLDQDPSHFRAWLQMGVSFEQLDLIDDARTCLKRAFDLDPLNRVVIAKLRELT